MSFEYSIKAFRSLKWFIPKPSLLLIKYWYFASYGSVVNKYILLMSGIFCIKFNNTFVFPDPEALTIIILYEWLEVYGQFLLCLVLFSLTISSKIYYLYDVASN